MTFELKHILAFISIIIFVVYYFLNNSPTRFYLLFVLVFLPFMDLNLTPVELGAISVFDFISWFVMFFAMRRLLYFQRNLAWMLFAILICLLFVGSLKSEFIQNSLINFFKFFSVFIYSRLLIEECTINPDFPRVVIKYLKIGGMMSLAFLSAQYLSGVNFTFYSEIHPNITVDVTRYPSYFQDPQKYAQYLGMISFFFLMYKGRTNQPPGLVNTIMFMMIMLAMLTTGSRMAFLGLCLGLALIILSIKSKLRYVAAISCILVYFILAHFSESFSLLNRAENYSSSIDARVDIWKENLEIFYAYPLLGIGIGNHHNFILTHSNVGYYLMDNEKVFYGTESGYLQILIEYGIFGFLIALFLITGPLIKALRSYRQNKQLNIIILAVSLLSWMIAWTTVNSLSDRRILIVVGIVLSLLVISKTQPESIHG